jgi:PHD/YefM family antitoxin component YafN of YafNO toxin-antitoxin module
MNNTNDNIKQQLHNMIDAIDDVQVLNVLKEEATAYIIRENEVVEDDDDIDHVANLSPEQLEDLEASIAEVERGEVVSYEEFKANIKQWLAE